MKKKEENNPNERTGWTETPEIFFFFVVDWALISEWGGNQEDFKTPCLPTWGPLHDPGPAPQPPRYRFMKIYARADIFL